jgi:cell division protein FtsI (penicillin-binding protein 3)
MTDERGSFRYLGIALLIGALMAGLVFRLVTLHLGLCEQARKPIVQSRTYCERLSVGRGRIVDGSPAANILAVNVGVKDVWADPTPLLASNRVAEVATALAPLLGVDVATITNGLNKPGRRFVYLARYVPDETTEAIARLKLPAIHMDAVKTRAYPQGEMLCHVLGFVNYDGVGSAGLELTLDRHLKGEAGVLESRLDGRRREMFGRRTREIASQDGADVVLTIDQNLQYMLEKSLTAALERHHARAGWAIMQRIRTGEILALVNRPAFDPNLFREATDDQKLNRAIGCTYEPGSTFKVTVIAAALNEGIVTPDTMFNCENGRWLYQNRILRDYHAYGSLSVADILKKSSNIGAAKIAIMLGDERMDRYLREFNIGSKLGIDMPGEENGILRPHSQWSAISSSRIAIGQGVAVTGLQMLGVLCGIANDGVIMRPYVVKEIVRADGRVTFRNQPQALGRPIRRETAALMCTLLSRVTEPGGTGVKAAVEGFKVAGKTGTAQKVVGGHYSETDYMASFVGFLPADNPEIGMLVVIDEPQPLHTGGTVSAPVFGEVAEQAARYLSLVPPRGFTVADNTARRIRLGTP